MDDGGPAFPRAMTQWTNPNDDVMWDGPEPGMSLRDWFAGMALMGLTTHNSVAPIMESRAHAMSCYALADAMLKAREKP